MEKMDRRLFLKGVAGTGALMAGGMVLALAGWAALLRSKHVPKGLD